LIEALLLKGILRLSNGWKFRAKVLLKYCVCDECMVVANVKNSKNSHCIQINRRL
jgi:hypothetical protein